ncbi:MAG: DUF4149 domain-containing protein [Candidatus Dormibacteraceae bacterium]
MAVGAPYLLTVQAVLAGIWLGSLVFTTLVVSPALKKMDWSERTRTLVRSQIGRQFRRLANPLLVLLAVFIVLAGLSRPLSGKHLAWFVIELALLVLVALLASSHGFYFGTRLQRLATADAGTATGIAGDRRRRLQRQSLAVSIVDLVASLALAVLAASW